MTFPVYTDDERLKILAAQGTRSAVHEYNRLLRTVRHRATIFGELCEEEDAMLHELASRTQTERMD
jgi:hypothetical protein